MCYGRDGSHREGQVELCCAAADAALPRAGPAAGGGAAAAYGPARVWLECFLSLLSENLLTWKNSELLGTTDSLFILVYCKTV